MPTGIGGGTGKSFAGI